MSRQNPVKTQNSKLTTLKVLLFIASLGPLAWLVWAASTGNLSANPLSDVTNETGIWTLRFLCITLAITPLRRVTGWNALIRFRRMTGLFAFFYGTLHFLIYVIVDRFAGLDFPDGFVAWSTVRNLARSVGEDIYKRPFITIGFTGLRLGYGRRGPLLVARQSRHPQSRRVCGHRHAAVGISGLVDAASRQPARPATRRARDQRTMVIRPSTCGAMSRRVVTYRSSAATMISPASGPVAIRCPANMS